MLDLRHITALFLWSALVLGLLWAVGAHYRNDSAPRGPTLRQRTTLRLRTRPHVSRVLGRNRQPYTPDWRRFRLILYD